MALNFVVQDHEDLTPRITVFGVGGAGGNAVNNMIDKNLQGVEFVVANTDAQALQQSQARSRIQLGVGVTEGLGAGARASVGAAAAEESIEEIIDNLAGAHMCFITAGMGGGTGTGAAPIIAQAARELGVLTVGVVTKPFQFEGSKRMRQAEEGVEALQKVVDTLIIIPNQNLFRLANEKTTFADAFALADDVLYQGVKGVTDLMVRPGLINLDFADVRAVMDEMGKAMMGTGEATGDDRAIQAAEKAIANPLLDEISLNGAKGVLINVTGGPDLTLFELDEAANLIREKVDADANIIVGSTLDPDMEGAMRVSVVATGIDASPAATEVPVPRRRLAEPLQPVTPPEAAAPAAPEPVAARQARPAPPPVTPAAEERTLFDPVGAAAPARDAHDHDADFDEDEVPPPAYERAQRAAAAARQDWQEAEDADWEPEEDRAASFVAPQPRPVGQPSPEALMRLQAAVDRSRTGEQPQTQPVTHAPGPVAQRAPAPAADRPRFGGINSLINRMTGHSGDAQPAPQPTRAEAARPQSPRVEAPRTQPRMAPPSRDAEPMSPEQERIEIPAFLRRQAN